MPQIEESIEIAVPRADVFRFCHDMTHRPEWDEQVEHIELLTPRPIRQGTLLRIDASHAGGAVFTWDAEYVDFQFLNISRVRALDTAVSSPFKAGSLLTWEFSTTQGGTRLTWSWDYQPRGFIANIMDKVSGRAATARAIRRSLEELKKLLESGRRATPTA